MTRRAIEIEGTGVTMELSKVVALDIKNKQGIWFEQLSDGTWRLTYTKGIIPDFSKVTSFKVIREDVQHARPGGVEEGNGPKVQGDG